MKSQGEKKYARSYSVSEEYEDFALNIDNQNVDVNQTVVCATFTISRPCTVQSDSKPHKVTIALIPLETEFEYVVVPSIDQFAYLKAKTNNASLYTLLPGRMSIFIDNFFVSTAALKLTSPGEDMELYLGMDSAIKVEHIKTPHTQGKKGQFLGMKKVKTSTMSYITNIKNNKSVKIKVTVLEQFPISQDTKVKITLLQPENKEEFQITERNNLIRWDFTLAPKEEKSLPFSYVIEYPENRGIQFKTKDEQTA